MSTTYSSRPTEASFAVPILNSGHVGMQVSLILDADANINTRVVELREHLSGFDYEFVVADRGSPHRVWLSKQADVQVLKANDDREVFDLLLRMARHEDRLIQEGDEWVYRHDLVATIAPPAIVQKKIRVARQSDSKRILMVSSFPDNTRGIAEALRSFGDVKLFDWKKESAATSDEEMNSQLIEGILGYEPWLVFMEEGFTGAVLPSTFQRVKSEISVAVVNWCGDIREEIPQTMLEMANTVDWTMLSNHPQVKQLQQMRLSALFLPAGCATEVYKRQIPDHTKYPAEIVFFGSGRHHYPLDDLRESVANSLYDRYGDKFRVYGRGWRKKSHPYVYDFIEPAEEEALAYSSCKVAIGISAFDWQGYTSARMWKAMGSGACYLPHYFRDIEKWFVRQQHCAWWKAPKELFSFIDYYLGNDIERYRMAEAGMQKVHAEHSWTKRMETMIRVVQGRKVKVF